MLLFCPAGGEGVEGEGQAEVNNIIEKIGAQTLSEENNGGYRNVDTIRKLRYDIPGITIFSLILLDNHYF